MCRLVAHLSSTNATSLPFTHRILPQSLFPSDSFHKLASLDGSRRKRLRTRELLTVLATLLKGSPDNVVYLYLIMGISLV